MKVRTALVCAAGLTFAAPLTADAGNGDKATGGGQVLIDSGDAKASTIAFTAQGTTSDAKGQVQLVDRSSTTPETKYHGVVDCIEVTGKLAVIGGYKKKSGPANTADRFVLRVMDNGEPNQGADMIQFDRESAAPDTCGNNDDNAEPDLTLARGNAQVRDGDASNPPARMMGFAKALSLAGLR